MIKTFELFELKTAEDPYGEERWEDPKIVGYFFAYQHRSMLSNRDAKRFLEEEKAKVHTTWKQASNYSKKFCLDDYDEAIFALYDDGEVKRTNWRNGEILEK